MERRERLRLCYLVERDPRGVFGVFIEPSDDVAALRAAIKEASFGYDDIDADELVLYLALQPSGDWLSSDSDEVKAIEEGDEDVIDKLCVTPLNLVDKLSQHFDAASLGRRKVHVLVKICYQMTVEERLRRSHEVRDGEVELWCIVIGEGTTIFPVIIKKLALIQDLQVMLKVRAYRLALNVREETINIYEAVDPHGNSLKDSSPDVAALRAGNEAVADKWLRKKLNPLKTIAEIFHNVEEHTVQFLVLPPSKFSVREFKRSWTPAEPYEEAAKLLKNAQEVSELVTIVKNLGTLSSANQQTIPFILMTSSSGTGKTQMAFNLIARAEFDVFWVGCVNGVGPIRMTFCYRSSAFIHCVDKDIREVGDAGVLEISQQSELYTYAFIRTMLRNLPGFTGPRTRAEVLDAIKDRRARGRHCVFFLDDYPHIDSSMSAEEKNLWTRKMRFMRNVFRSFGLVVIVSASNKAAKSILSTAIKTPTDDELWCVVYPLLPRFEHPSLKSLPNELQTIITSSRPLFAKPAMEYVSSEPFEEGADAAKYLDAMIQSLARRFVYGGRYTPENFNESHTRLFLASSYKKSNSEHGDTDAPAGDFSRVYETEVFQLWLRDGEYPVKGANGVEPWRWSTIFPTPMEDTLLHLCLGAVHVFKNQRVSPISLREAFAFESVANTTMTELVAGALVVASRRGGFGGLPFPLVLTALLYELGVLRERDTEVQLSGKVTGLATAAVKIPFLAQLERVVQDFCDCSSCSMQCCDAIEILSIGYILAVYEDKEGVVLTRTQQSLLAAAIFAGMFTGGLLFGSLSDYIARRKSLLYSLLLNGVFGLLSALSPNVYALIIFRTCAGVGIGGTVPAMFTLCSEHVPAHRRGYYVTIVAAYWMVGAVFTAGLAWFMLGRPEAVYSWRAFAAMVSLPSFACWALIYRYVPESAQFFLRHRLLTAAELVVDTIHATNTGDDDRLTESTSLLARHNASSHSEVYTESSNAGIQVEPSTWTAFGLLFDPVLRGTTISLLLSWFCLSFGSYGLATWITMLFKRIGLEDPFANAFIYAAANLPGNIMTALLMDRHGGRRILAVSMLLSAGCAIGFAYANSSASGAAAIVLLASGFNAFSTAGWNAIDLMSAESFPTDVRTTGMSMLSAAGRAGSVAAQFVNGYLIGPPVHVTLLLVITATMMLLGSASSVFVVAFSNKTLPEPVEAMRVTERAKRSKV